MSVPPQGPQWARPDQPDRQGKPAGGPVPPAPAGQPLQPGHPAPGAGDGGFTPSGTPGAGQHAAPQFPGAPGPQAQQPGTQQPPQMLGDEAVAGAAQAARKHSSNRIIDTSSSGTDGLNKCPRCGGTDIQYSLTAKALVCAYCRHSWNEENAEQAFGLDSSI
ncbi:MAG: hypothetical protein ACTHWV_15555, partial [Brachybacterium sp.]